MSCVDEICNSPIFSPCQSALKGTHGRGSRMNQSWGRGVWGSGTMTHSCCVSERRTRPAVSRRRTRGLVNKPELGVFYREGQCDSSMSIMTRNTLLYGSSSPHPPLTSPPQHHLPLLFSLQGSVRKRCSGSGSGSELLPLHV